jgi:peptidoglycan hydrolase-like protein with peptidoglycan-binding domain
MKKLIFLFLLSLCLSAGVNAQSAAPQVSPQTAAANEKPKRQIFRANKDQITQAQKMLKAKSLYSGEPIGKLDDATRASIKLFQKDNGLKETGTLNRATLEKMGIELTDKQKLIPVSPNSYAGGDNAAGSTAASDSKPKRVIFRATKDQIADAQKMLKAKGMYAGEESGKLDEATREGLKKFQETSGLKITGTLNQTTLEKMGIELTEKQKGDAAANK